MDTGEPGKTAAPEPDNPAESATAPADSTVTDDETGAAPDAVPRRRPAPGLGPEWAITGDDGGDITLWREDHRAGVVGRAPFSSRWEARRASGGPVTTLAAKDGRYPSRVKALAALAAEVEHARRRATVARQVPLAVAGPGWQLTQTLADTDEGAWQVTGPRRHPGRDRPPLLVRCEDLDRDLRRSRRPVRHAPGPSPRRGRGRPGRRLAHPGRRRPRHRHRPRPRHRGTCASPRPGPARSRPQQADG